MIRLICVASALFIGGVALAQPSSTNSISLQAKLEGVTGGTVNLTVRFYPTATGGSQVGPTINLTGVPVTDGVVSVPVSPIDPSVFNGSTRFMGISVNGGAELSPRTMVTSVPYAVAAAGVQLQWEPSLASQAHLTNGRASPVAGLLSFGDGSGWEFNAKKHDLFGGGIIAQLTDKGQFTVFGPLSGLLVRNLDVQRYVGYLDQVSGHGRLALFNAGVQDATIVLAGETGEVRCRILQINGGSDIAEPASVTPIPEVGEVLPGMVMVIDRQHDGKLVPCTAAYDRAVAGVISGANDLKPGLVLRAEGQPLTDGEHPLAMTGRVWVWCDASFGSVRRGDSLTTSSTPGHAMVAADESRAGRAVLGKAMTELREGRGLVLVLVNLQ